MKKKTTLFALTGIILSCHLFLAGCQKTENTAINHQDVQSSNISKVDENTIVVSEIKSNGYMRLYGEESYFFEGPIPYAAHFLKDTLPDSDYKLNKEDIQYQLEKGYIIKVNEQYFYYPKDKDANVISISEAKKLTKNQKKPTSQAKKGVAGVDYPTDDGFLFENEDQILSKTDEGLVLEHNGHSHFIFYKDLKESKWSYLVPKEHIENSQSSSHSNAKQAKLSQTFDDGYVFDPKDIVAEDANGYTVRHGDHYHYIWKSSLQYGQGNTGETIGKKGQITVLDNHSLHTPTTRNNSVPLKATTEKGHTSTQSNSKKAFPGIDYPTSDGFLFDGSGVQGQTALGLLIGHGTHTHLLPYSHLIGSPWESYIPTQYLETARAEYHSSTSTQVDVEIPLSSQEGGKPNSSVEEEREAKKSYLAENLHVSKEKIKVIETDAGPAFVYPHGDHSHTILIEKVEVGKPIEDPHGDPHAHDKIGMATLKQLGFDDEIIEDILHATADTPFPSNETDSEKMREWLKTVKYLNIGQRKDPLKRAGLDLMPNVEVLGIGFTPIDDVKPILQFKKLKQLWMTSTGVKDYQFLKEIPTLEGIDLSQNGVSDLGFLEEFPNLKVVSAAGNDIEDITILAKLKALESLNLDHNKVTDLSPLADLSQLTAVSLDNNRITDLSALQNKKKLTRLYISQNPQLDISTLKTENLEELTANESNVKDLQFVKNNPNLTSLTLKNNKITELQGIEENEKLVNLDVEGNQIKTLEIEGKQESVVRLNVADNQLKNLEGVNDYKALEDLNASKNDIETLAITEPNKTLKTIDVSENHIPKEELNLNDQKIPSAIAEHFPAVEGGSIENNQPKEVDKEAKESE